MISENKYLKIIFFVFFFLIIMNLIYVDYLIFIKSLINGNTVIKNETFLDKDEDISSALQDVNKASCSESCLTKIYEATSSAVSTMDNNKTQITSDSKIKQATQISQVKEYFIPLGSGSLSSTEWGDVPGVQATIDSNRYGSIKSVVFEPSVHIPTGNETVYIRLFNVTDKHPVWFSEVSLSGGTPQLLFSQPITFDSGVKTYQVQIKTSLNYPAVLDQARIHITIY